MGILDKRSGGGGADNETAQRPNEQEARHQNLSSRSCARRRRPNSFTLSTPSSCLISSPKPLFALLRSASSPQLVYLIHPIIMPGLLTTMKKKNNNSSNNSSSNNTLENTTWVPPDRQSRVTISRDDSTGNLVGRISWLKDEERSTQLDFRNPDRKLRQRTLLGLPILVNFQGQQQQQEKNQKKKNQMFGEIYDPQRGWNIRGQLQLNERGDKLRVKGWVGMGPLRISRSYLWSKQEEEEDSSKSKIYI